MVRCCLPVRWNKYEPCWGWARLGLVRCCVGAVFLGVVNVVFRTDCRVCLCVCMINCVCV